MSSKVRTVRPATAKRRLRFALTVFVAALGIPFLVLVSRLYRQLQWDAFYQYRSSAEGVVQQINSRIVTMLTPEQLRPFDEYGFFSTSSNTLLNAQAVTFSPLAQYPLRSDIPGMVGYFQINPDDSFHSPVVPDLPLETALSQAPSISSEEFEKRSALRDTLQKIVRVQDLSRGSAREKRRAQKEESLRKENPARQELQGALDQRFEENFSRGQVRALQAPAPEQQQSGGKAWLSRKEKLNMVENSFNTIQQQISTTDARQYAGGASKSKDSARPETDELVYGSNTLMEPPRISAVEGEIDPFQFTLLRDGHASFLRKVWQQHQRFIQGFVVEREPFFSGIAASTFFSSSLPAGAKLLILTTGAGVREYVQRGKPVSSSRPVLVYRSLLVSPLDEYELIFSVPSVPYGSGSELVHFLVFLTLSVGLLGVYGIYRTGLRQIALAEQQQDFVSAVSHELKTPLTSIRMYGEMLRGGMVPDHEKKQQYYEYIFHESERLSRLIANVLQVARLSRGEAPLTLEKCSVLTLVDLVRSKAASQAEAARCAFSVQMDKRLEGCHVVVDKDAFVQIFVNLVDNAIKFSRDAEHKEVVLECNYADRERAGAIFSVRDFGPGVDPSQQQKIFELFYRAGEGKVSGTGIGLALVREFAQRMGASVDVQDAQPGARFSVSFDTKG